MKRKNKVIVSIKKKRKPKHKSLMPQELSSGRPDIQQKLGKRQVPVLRRSGLVSNTFKILVSHRPDWDTLDTLESNYGRVGFVTNPNASFGRNTKLDALQVCSRLYLHI